MGSCWPSVRMWALATTFSITKPDPDAEPVWEAGEVQQTSTPASRFRLSSLPPSQQQLAYVWQDDRCGAAGIYAQNMNADGSLGIPEEDPEPVQEFIFYVDMSVQESNGSRPVSTKSASMPPASPAAYTSTASKPTA